MTQKLSIGILGTGFSSVHVDRLGQLDDVAVTAVCGRSFEKAQIFIQRMGLVGATAFGDFDQMLEDSRMDALYICLPPHAHHGQEAKAARRGIHLFLEKPIAYDLAQAEAIVDVIESAGVISQVGYQMRYFKVIRAFKALSNPGRPSLFEGRFWVKFEGPSWWLDKASSNGQVHEQVTHIYDLARFLMGEPESASGWLANLCHQDNPAYTVEDTSVAAIRFRNGALGMISGSNCAIPERFLGGVRAVFENVTLEINPSVDPKKPNTSTLYIHDGKTITRQLDFIEDGDPYLDQTAAFLKAVRGEGPQVCPVREGLQDIRLTNAVMQSAEKDGQPIRI
jgi:predicted dehydrogenase